METKLTKNGYTIRKSMCTPKVVKEIKNIRLKNITFFIVFYYILLVKSKTMPNLLIVFVFYKPKIT